MNIEWLMYPLIFSFFASILMAIISFGFLGSKNTMIYEKKQYELFHGNVYKFNWTIKNGKCIEYYKDQCYNMNMIYEYTIYANNTDNFCVAGIKSGTNITETMMNEYYIGKNITWSKKKKNKKNRECRIVNSRHYYQNRVDLYDNHIKISLWVLTSTVSLFFAIIIGLITYNKICSIYDEYTRVHNNQVHNDIEMNNNSYNQTNTTKDTKVNTTKDTKVNATKDTKINTTKDTKINTTKDTKVNKVNTKVNCDVKDIEMNIKSNNNTVTIKQTINECVCCLDIITHKIAFIPCGHTQTCEECYNSLPVPKCPICSKEIKSTLKIFVD